MREITNGLTQVKRVQSRLHNLVRYCWLDYSVHCTQVAPHTCWQLTLHLCSHVQFWQEHLCSLAHCCTSTFAHLCSLVQCWPSTFVFLCSMLAKYICVLMFSFDKVHLFSAFRYWKSTKCVLLFSLTKYICVLMISFDKVHLCSDFRYGKVQNLFFCTMTFFSGTGSRCLTNVKKSLLLHRFLGIVSKPSVMNNKRSQGKGSIPVIDFLR